MRIRRSRLEILAEILAIVEEKTEIAKTHIMYRANISFKQLQMYLSFLLRRELIRKVKKEDRLTYEITEKGSLFLESYRNIEALSGEDLKEP